MQYQLKYGRRLLKFEVIQSPRKTLQIEVYPDQRIRVKAPNGIQPEEVARRVQRKGRWIVRQLDYFQQFEPRTPPRKYIGGETHLYLGRQYRLKILQAGECSVKLVRGYFRISVNGSPTPQITQSLLDQWYTEKAQIKFTEAFERCWPKFERMGLNKPMLVIKRMKTRWGSLSENGRLTLNIDLIRAPAACIDYVVTHELCHLQHHNHSPAFYTLLEKSMPDWKKRKHRLELSLI
ncbi:SprT family zinc-dependent metalloprotease [Pontiellaceae bacterium B12219]|nr:SprT family zinc-dependent metalloprotease [Pontiellaceae bacterium B12219]